MSDVNRARATISQVPLKANEATLKTVDAWQVITLLPRIDAFNHADLVAEIHEALAEGAKRIALDLTHNRFFSLNAIQFCTSVARDLAYDGGHFALIGCMERTRRHFDIYGSTKQIRTVRSIDELALETGVSITLRARSISQELR